MKTRIHAHQPQRDSIYWTIEYQKPLSRVWRTYAYADTVGDAEKLREECLQNGGKPQVVCTSRKGFRRFRVIESWSEFSRRKTYKVETRGFLEFKYRYWSIEYLLENALERCANLPTEKHKYHQHGVIGWFRTVGKAVSSTVMCLRYPFLYPRNRFTGKHYNNWELDDLIKKTFECSYELLNPVKYHPGLSEEELYDMQHPKYRITDFWKAVYCRILKIYRGLLQFIHCVPTYTELDAMDSGWRKAFGRDLINDLKKILKKNHMLHTYRIMQIKEKWGELCWYDSAAPREWFDRFRYYEGLSYRTCINCGRPAKYRTTGYILPYCEECMPKKDLEYGHYSILKDGETGWEEIDLDTMTSEEFEKSPTGEN